AGSKNSAGQTAYKIYFGDGASYAGAAANHSYAVPGNYLAAVLLVATYADGSTNTSVAYFPVEVVAGSMANPAPVADFSAPENVRSSQPVVVDAGLTSAPGATGLSYAWDFGDGSTATGPAASHVYAP